MNPNLRWPWYLLAAISSLILYGQLLVGLAGWRPVFVYPYHMLMMLAIGSLLLSLGFLLSTLRKMGRNGFWIRFLGASLATLLLVVGRFWGIAQAITSPYLTDTFLSPDLRHQIVVLSCERESGKTYYNACPMVWGFYRDSDLDNFVIREKGVPEKVRVSWYDAATARVYFIYDAEAGSVREDSVIITFR